MHGEASRQKRGVFIACNPATLTAEQRERQRALIGLLPGGREGGAGAVVPPRLL